MKPILVLTSTVFLFVGCQSDDRQPQLQDESAAVVDGLFEVDGHRLFLECAGSGSPTLILDHGQGTSRRTWGPIWPDLIRMTKTCRYDRAGRGDSEPGPIPTSTLRIGEDLNGLLDSSGIEPPYVVVGHSFGGLNAQVFALTYPEKVLGLVLVDPSGGVDAFAFLETPFWEANGRFSPDGRWIAYVSDETGQWEVHVRPFEGEPAGTEGRIQISDDGGVSPVWGPEGQELFYISEDILYTVDTADLGGQASVLLPSRLFQACPDGRPMGFASTLPTVAPYHSLDGERFLISCQREVDQFVVLLDWNAHFSGAGLLAAVVGAS